MVTMQVDEESESECGAWRCRAHACAHSARHKFGMRQFFTGREHEKDKNFKEKGQGVSAYLAMAATSCSRLCASCVVSSLLILVREKSRKGKKVGVSTHGENGGRQVIWLPPRTSTAHLHPLSHLHP
jgi:hypothetical protein